MKKIYVEGMSCMHCVMRIKNALNEVSGIKKVEVDLKGKYVTVECENVSNSILKEIIEDAGYDVIEIEEI